jgi:hypothetical protein
MEGELYALNSELNGGKWLWSEGKTTKTKISKKIVSHTSK